MSEPFPAGITAPLDWLNGIMPAVPGVHIDVVKHLLVEKLREFFDTSKAWRDWVGPITLHSDTAIYSVELSDWKAELVSVLAGYRLSDEGDLHPAMDSDPRVQQMLTDNSGPEYFYRTVENEVAIFPRIRVGEAEKVMLYVVMKPMDLCVPTWIKLRYYESIKAGVLGAIYLMPGVSYKADLGARMERRFRRGMSVASHDSVVSGTGVTKQIPIQRQVVGSQGRRIGRMAISGRRW